MFWSLPLLSGWYDVVPTASISRVGKENPLNPTGHINPRSLDGLSSCLHVVYVFAAVDGRCAWSCRMFRDRGRVVAAVAVGASCFRHSER